MNQIRARHLFSCALLLTLASCVCGTLPPSLSSAESNRCKSTHLNYTVGVEPFHYPAYSNDLLIALRDTHLFISVKPLDECTTPPVLVAKVDEEDYGGVATIPFWTFLSLGVVPAEVNEGYGYHCSFRFSDDTEHRYLVRYDFRSHEVMGWLALFELLSPNVGWDVERSDRFRGRFALTVLDHLPEQHP
jgi:hypothetical protein